MLDNDSLLVKYGIDVTARQIILSGAVEENLLTRTLIGLRILARQDATQPATVVINTYGGELCQALAIIEAIKSAPMPVDTHAVGACMSAGAIILQAGQHRSASPDCSIMIHFGSEENDSGSEAKHNAKLTKRMKDILRDRTSKSTRTINNWLEKDTYFTADEALKAFIIDEVKS